MKTFEPVKSIQGEISLLGDKSISHRAIMLGAIARGISEAKNILDCDDCNYTLNAFKKMGIRIESSDGILSIFGGGLKGLSKPDGVLDVGNSGTTMRVLSGILSGQSFESTLTGNAYLSKRPMARIVEPLSRMGVNIRAEDGRFPPLVISGGKVHPIDYALTIPSAQVKSAVLLAGLYAEGKTTVHETFKSRDHTERMLRYFGADISIDGLSASINGGKELIPRFVDIPGDISSASFFLAAAVLLKGSRILLKGVGVNPTRSGILNVLTRMGAKIEITNKRDIFEPVADIIAQSSSLRGVVIKESEIPTLIDELPVLFVIASLAKGKTVIEGAGELKVKETDRINSMKENISRMGGRFFLEGDTVIIEGVKSLAGSSFISYADHRTAMAMAIASLTASGKSSIDDINCVSKSFPGFFDVLDGLVRK